MDGRTTTMDGQTPTMGGRAKTMDGQTPTMGGQPKTMDGQTPTMDGQTMRNVSLSLARIMDRKIGTQESVAITRFIHTFRQELMTGDHYDVFYSGSRGEGLHLPGSDEDYMIIYKNIFVLGPDEPVPQSADSNTTHFRITHDGCRPGFVLLQLILPIPTSDGGILLNSNIIKCLVYDGDGTLCVSSKLLREVHVQERKGFVEHGPCATLDTTEAELDFVYCFPYKSWPIEAGEWGSSRSSGYWPPPELSHAIKRNGCHVVPIGDPHSDSTELQWRISFSLAEQALVHSLTHAQFRVYGVLKLFLKEAINNNENIEGLLCSYFIKTVIFHAVHETPRSLWTEKNTFFCFWLCFNLLIDWVRVGYCPNFFIPQNNMFYGKIIGERKKLLLGKLLEYRSMGWMCLYQCTTFTNINPIHETPCLSALEKELSSDIASAAVLSLSVSNLRFSFLRRVLRSMHSHLPVREFLGDVLFWMAQDRRGLELLRDYGTSSNKKSYSLLRKSKVLLSISSRCTDASGPLSLATYHYQTGNYSRAIQQCKQVETAFQPYTLNGNVLNQDDARMKWYEANVCGSGLTIMEKLRKYWMKFLLLDVLCPTYPSEIHPEVAAAGAVEAGFSIAPLPYAAFMTFLCCKSMGDTKGTDKSLRNLQELVREKEHSGHWIVRTLLGICCQALGDYRQAALWYQESLSMDEMFNPANERLIKLLEYL